MARRAGITGRLLYGAFFLIGVPVLLILWARATEDVVPLPPLHHTGLGAALAGAGFLLMATGWTTLIARGDGLPMNAFPPARLVTSGVFGWLRDPIYVGFGMLAFGVSITAGSASGLWLVAPATSLAMAALVLGYERPDLRRRFGEAAAFRPRIAFPAGSPGSPGRWERLSVLLLVFGPWLLAYYGVQFLGVPGDAFSIEFPFERELPVLQWTEFVYASTYLFVPLAPLLVDSRPDLRRFAVTGITATLVVTLLWLTIPAVVAYRPFEPTNLPGRLLRLERDSANGMASFPAFHVLWTLIAADAWTHIRWVRKRAVLRCAVWSLATLICASCVTTGMHAALDVLAAIVLFVPLRDPHASWELLRSAAERVANSWREWRVGRVRILSHGFFAALAAGLGTLVAGSAAGPSFGSVLLLGLCALAGAGLWAQTLEGSPKLLRPFGYYGGMLGMLVGAAVAWLVGVDAVLVLGAWAVALPWVQATGRLRCLVQGCCHGGPAPPHIGIRYFHSRSRVSQFADLAGVPLHPTPLYSILANAVAGLLLLRLWTAGAAPAVVVGTYLMLTGSGRFVEESWRAEPQTLILRGLHIYHWLALFAFAMGALATTLPSVPPPVPFAAPLPRLLPASLAFALLAGFAMGVDFPGSHRRFARLAVAEGPARLADRTGGDVTSGSPRSPR